MKFIFKTLSDLFRNQKMMSFNLIISTSVSLLVMLFAYGAFINYKLAEQNKKAFDHNYVVNFRTDGDLSQQIKISDIRKSIEMLPKDIIKFTASNGVMIDDNFCGFHYNIETGVYELNDSSTARIDKLLDEGRTFTNDEIKNGTKSIILTSESYNGKNYKVGDQIEYFDSIYTVIGLFAESDQYHGPFAIVPPESIERDLTSSTVDFTFAGLPTKDIVKTINTTLTENLNTTIQSEELVVADTDLQKYYTTMKILIILIVVVAAVNLFILFRYIVAKEMRKYILFKMCGAGNTKLSIMHTFQIMMIILPVLLITGVIYHYVIRLRLLSVFTYWNNIYSTYTLKTYFLFISAVLLAAIITLNINMGIMLNKPIVQSLRKKNK